VPIATAIAPVCTVSKIVSAVAWPLSAMSLDRDPRRCHHAGGGADRRRSASSQAGSPFHPARRRRRINSASDLRHITASAHQGRDLFRRPWPLAHRPRHPKALRQYPSRSASVPGRELQASLELSFTWKVTMPRYYFNIENGHRLIDPSGLDCSDDGDAFAKAKQIAAQISLEIPGQEGHRHIAVVGPDGEISKVPIQVDQAVRQQDIRGHAKPR
jgi:hypothetical protein